MPPDGLPDGCNASEACLPGLGTGCGGAFLMWLPALSGGEALPDRDAAREAEPDVRRTSFGRTRKAVFL